MSLDLGTLIAHAKLDDRNPRQHSPKQVRQIARSIEAFGFNVPVLVDEAGVLVAGPGPHATRSGARRLR